MTLTNNSPLLPAAPSNNNSLPTKSVCVSVAQNGLSLEEFNELQVVRAPPAAPDAAEDMCSVCYCEKQEGELLRVLPNCPHTFHKDCIDAWFIENASCPECRRRSVSQRTRGQTCCACDKNEPVRVDNGLLHRVYVLNVLEMLCNIDPHTRQRLLSPLPRAQLPCTPQRHGSPAATGYPTTCACAYAPGAAVGPGNSWAQLTPRGTVKNGLLTFFFLSQSSVCLFVDAGLLLSGTTGTTGQSTIRFLKR